MAQKQNYQTKLDEILKSLTENKNLDTAHRTLSHKALSRKDTSRKDTAHSDSSRTDAKPTLLLHACCAPCSSYVIEYLSRYFDITIYYYNPNIFPESEYTRRRTELEKFLRDFSPSAEEAETAPPHANNFSGDFSHALLSRPIKFVEAAYKPTEYYDATKTRTEIALQTEAERGTRCFRCYELRMRSSYEYALAHGFDWFCTTLSISPHKDAEKINEIGFALENEYAASTRWLPSDFKKRGGFKRSLELSRKYNLYRQDYCGCEFSKVVSSHT